MSARPASLVLAMAALLASALPLVGLQAEGGPDGAAVERAAAALNPSLVRIHVVTVEYIAGRETKQEATGSGVILTKEGHVITNHHVAGNAKQITCTLADGEEVDAELVGTDPLTDICVVKLQPEQARDFAAATFGDSSQLKVGDRVLALGSPLALSQSVTLGIVSNTELVIPGLFWPFRFEVEGEDVGSFVRWIGHDAAISPGNSGGPLADLSGRVVGINEMRFGLSAAIPGNLAREVAQQLIDRGTVSRSWIGLDVQPMLKSARGTEGALVGGTFPDSPAERAGFRSGDILVSLAGSEVRVRVPEELPLFNQLVGALPVGEEVEAEVIRDGEKVALRITAQQRERVQPKERELSDWGITARNLSRLGATELRRDTPDGVLVTSVRPGGPCDTAKPRISDRDVILEVAGEPVKRVEDLAEATERITAGKDLPAPVLVSYERKSQRYLTVVQVGERPPSEPAREVQKAWLPVDTQVLTREMAEALDLGDRTGVRVTEVYAGRSADQAGLQVGDIIVALDGETIPASRPEHVEVFPAMVRQRRIDSQAELTVLRGGKEMKLDVTLERSPRLPREMQRYRDDNFEFSARDVAFEDRVRYRWQEKYQGVFIEAVSEGGWAALAHLAVGDLLMEVDGRPTPDVASFEEQMKQIAADKPEAVVFRIRRRIHDLYVELKPRWPQAE